MEFRSNNPGSVQFGNFINYYDFNSAEERIKLLPKDVWQDDQHLTSDDEPYLVLDVGCNTGVLTRLLYRFLQPCVNNFYVKKGGLGRAIWILAIDIDASLIERAIVLLKEDESFDVLERAVIRYETADVMDTSKFDKIVNCFLKDWERSRFDAVCCFSITMWVHLNHGDDGLQKFLSKLASYAALFVVEPQPWKCYQTAVRRLRKGGEEFPQFLKLKWRSHVEKEIQTYMEEVLKMRKINECQPTNWKRRICFYRHS